MFNNLFKTAISLIFKPANTWNELGKKQSDDHEKFLLGFVYPIIGLVTLSAFLGILLTRKVFDLQIALKESLVALFSVFGGFFLASWLINEVLRVVFHREPNYKLCQRFTGYSSSLLYCLNIVLSLIPEFFFLRLFVLYTIYMVWEGAVPYIDIKESEQLKFVSITTLIIIATPWIIEFILGWLMPGLRL